MPTPPTIPSVWATATHGTRRPKRDTVRSEIAPKTGLATTETAAPTPATRPKANSLLPGASSAACWASSTWIGPKNPAHNPMEAKVIRATPPPAYLALGLGRPAR
jgi:hypothetical protein